MNILGFDVTEHSDQKEPYKLFVKQLSKWWGGAHTVPSLLYDNKIKKHDPEVD